MSNVLLSWCPWTKPACTPNSKHVYLDAYMYVVKVKLECSRGKAETCCIHESHYYTIDTDMHSEK